MPGKKVKSTRVLKIIGEPVRAAIIKMLSKGGLRVSQIIKKLNIEPAVLCRHLNILEAEGLIRPSLRGDSIVYRLSRDAINYKGNKGLAFA